MNDSSLPPADNGLTDLIELADSLAAGQWLQIPGSNIPLLSQARYNEILASTGSAPFWGNGAKAVITAWNSAAYDPVGHRFFVMGGGHTDYGGNEVYAYDLDTLEWTRLTDPAPLTVQDGGQWRPDGSPAAPHTYDGLVWNPVTETLWLTTTAYSYAPTGYYFPTEKAFWEFDPETLSWTAHAQTVGSMPFASSAWLEGRYQILVLDASGTVALINSDGSVVRGSGGQPRDLGSAEYDPVRDVVYELGRTGIRAIDVADDGHVTSTVVARFDRDMAATFNFAEAGMAYHPGLDAFLISGGDRDVWLWDPDDGSFEHIFNTVSPQGPDGVGRLYDRIEYIPEADAFVMIGTDANASEGVWIYKLGQDPASVNQIDVGTATVDPTTLHGIGINLPVAGGDLNDDAEVHVWFREAGRPGWHEGLDLMRVHPELIGDTAPETYGLTSPGEGFAGSVFGLKPGTTYEIRLQIDDPDGVGRGRVIQHLTATTRDLPVDVAADPATTTLIEVATTAELNTALAGAAAGDVIVLRPGVYSGSFTVNASGTAERPIIVTALDRDATIIDASGQTIAIDINGDNVHLHNLTIANSTWGVAAGDTSGVVISGNHITNVASGIGARVNAFDMSIYDNLIEGRFAFGNTSNATWDTDGVVVSGQGIDIFANTVSGFGDSLGLTRNAPTANIGIDIFANKVLWGGDDGIELDYSYRNVAAHDNLLTNTASGVSFQPIWGGPAYAFGNAVVNTLRGPIKLKNDPTGMFIANNTFVKDGIAWVNETETASNFKLLNNLFLGTSTTDALWTTTSFYREDVDYNGWSVDGRFQMALRGSEYVVAANLATFQTKSGHELHGLILEGDVFAGYSFGTDPFAVERDVDAISLVLAGTSNAIDAGVVLPTINDGFAGAAPDLGAIERGRAAPDYGADGRSSAAVRDDDAITGIDIPVAIDVTSNDAPGLALLAVGQGDHGRTSIAADGHVIYVPDAGFIGTDRFVYLAGDGAYGVAAGEVVVTVDVVLGGSGVEVIPGTPDNDFIDGSDSEVARQVLGGAGRDTIFGSSGNDTITGGEGIDFLAGGAGNDVFLIGGSSDGMDRFRGDGGCDVSRGSDGDEVLGIVYLRSVERIDGGGGINRIPPTSIR